MTDEKGFLLSGYQFKPVTPVGSGHPASISQSLRAAGPQPPPPVNNLRAQLSAPSTAKKAAQQRAAMAAGNASIAKSFENMRISSQMMAIHSKNMSRW